MNIHLIISTFLIVALCTFSPLNAGPDDVPSDESEESSWVAKVIVAGTLGIGFLFKNLFSSKNPVALTPNPLTTANAGPAENRPPPKSNKGKEEQKPSVANFGGCGVEGVWIRGINPNAMSLSTLNGLGVEEAQSSNSDFDQIPDDFFRGGIFYSSRFTDINEAIEKLDVDAVRYALGDKKKVANIESVRSDLRRRKTVSTNEEEQENIQQILDLVNLANLSFEQPSALLAHQPLEGIGERHPLLYRSYERLNMQGDGSCWLSGLWYVTLHQLLADRVRMDNFRAQVLSMVDIAEVEPYVSDVVDALSNLQRVAQSEGRPQAIQATMTNFKYAYALRMFARLVIANSRASGLDSSMISFADSVILNGVRSLNAEGGNEELGIFAQIFKLDMHVIAKDFGFQFSLAINAGIRDEKEGNSEVLVNKQSPLLISTSGHYAILKPKD